jgi:butyrate response factor 1
MKYAPSLLTMTEQANFNAAHMRKLERSFSEPVDNRPSKSSNINPSRYKTEMCRPFEESGHCKYGDKCQFAHGAHELRNLARHPKYKTDLCRTFHTIGFCPYGPRCHFIHNEDERKLHFIVQQKQQQAMQEATQQAVQQQLRQMHMAATSAQPAPIQRPKLMMNMPPPGFSRDALGSAADSPPDSLTSESPQSLSPTSNLSEHYDSVFSPCSSLGSTAITPPPMNYNTLLQQHQQQQHGDNNNSPSALNMNMRMSSTPTPIMTPLKVNTDSFVSLAAGMAAFQHQQQQQLQQHQQNSHFNNTNDLFNTPPSPPHSINGEEVDSIFRLPFFTQLGEPSS